MEIVNPTHFRAKKIGGSYQADGTVIASFQTLDDKPRYVFEFDAPRGCLHIFGPEQLVIEKTGCVIMNLDAISRQVLFEAYAETFGPLDPNLTANDIEFHICELIKDAGPARVNEPCPDPLVPYLRQYVHNDRSPGFVFGYEKVGTDREFARLGARVKELEARLSHDLHAAIMRLPCEVPEHLRGTPNGEHFKQGHRDGRHAAAALVSEWEGQ